MPTYNITPKGVEEFEAKVEGFPPSESGLLSYVILQSLFYDGPLNPNEIATWTRTHARGTGSTPPRLVRDIALGLKALEGQGSVEEVGN